MRLIETEIIKKVEEGNKQTAVHAQCVGRILNANEEARKHSDENWKNADPDIKHVGCVPRVVVMLWQQMGIMDDANELMKALERNPEYKTTEKQLAEKPGLFFDLGSKAFNQ